MQRMEHYKARGSALNSAIIAAVFFLLGLLTMIEIDAQIIGDMHLEISKLEQAKACETPKKLHEVAIND